MKLISLMVNLHRNMKFLTCLALITACMGCAGIQKHENSVQYDEDSVITTKVKAAILDIKTLQVFVKTHKGVVVLSGYVDSAQSVTNVGDIARRVKNVVSVENDLVVNCVAVSRKCEIHSDKLFINALR